MRIRYQREKLSKVISDFYDVTGVRIAILDTEFKSICTLDRVPKFCACIQSLTDNEKCKKSDLEILNNCRETGQANMHVCHAGLIDIAIPIMHRGTPIGYIIMGQMRRDIPFDSIMGNYDYQDTDIKRLEEYYNELYVYDDKKIKSISNLAVMLTSYIMAEDMIRPEYDGTFSEIIEYIENNLSEKISVILLSKKFGFSKNTLYRLFESQLGMPVNEYIIKRRIERAKVLLKNKTLSISEVGDNIGMENYSYFAKIFKEKTGLTPSGFRKAE